jgi:uncharacterized protein YcbK (DUF882 family)
MLLPLLPLHAVLLVSLEVSAPVTINLYDENHREAATVVVNRDGTVDEANDAKLRHLLRCKRTERKHKINEGTLRMFAAVAAEWPGATIELVSGYRAMRSESRTSPHRKARAIDFRIRGVSTVAVRDFMWRTFREVGVGYYPEGAYVHLDHRPGLHDTAWTFKKGKNRYRPSWAERIRPAYEEAEDAAKPSKSKPKKHEHKHDRGGAKRTRHGIGV